VALDLALPIIVHDREAHEECLSILREEGGDRARGVFHCFSGDRNFARRVIEAGFHLGFDGPITYPRGKGDPDPEVSRAVVREMPLDRLLIETDCPYLTPQRFGGKKRRNEPAYVVAVAEKVAELRGMSVAEVAAATTANALALFG
jgi:TatD DNase family protein